MATPLIATLTAAKTVQGLFNLIDSGQVALLLGDVEMSAAKAAFEAVPRAIDKRGQVWECIGHLTSAQHAYEKYILSRAPGNVTMTRGLRDNDANVKRRFALILKAVCYRYLGERQLCREALQMAGKTFEKEMPTFERFSILGYLAVTCITGSLLVEVAYTAAKGIGDADSTYGVSDEALASLSGLLNA